MKKKRRGGPRKGAGLKPGTPHKNAQKLPEERHSVKKQVSYTPDEWDAIQAKIESLSINFAEFAREATLKYDRHLDN